MRKEALEQVGEKMHDVARRVVEDKDLKGFIEQVNNQAVILTRVIVEATKALRGDPKAKQTLRIMNGVVFESSQGEWTPAVDVRRNIEKSLGRKI